MLKNTDSIQNLVKKSSINRLSETYSRAQQPLAFVILFTATIFSAFGLMQLAVPALAGIGLIALQVLFAIESRQSELRNTKEFTDFQSASLDIAETIQQSLSKKNRVDIKWIGTTMGRGGPFLINQINQLLRNNCNSKIVLEIFMLSPDYPELALFNTKWPSQAKNNYQILNDWISNCNPEKLEGSIYKYDFPPMYIGLLIDNQVLYTAFGSWEENVTGINSKGNQPNYEYCVGMNPHYKYESRTLKGTEHIRQYLAWVHYLKK